MTKPDPDLNPFASPQSDFERVSFPNEGNDSLEYAGFPLRFLAFVIDAAIACFMASGSSLMIIDLILLDVLVDWKDVEALSSAINRYGTASLLIFWVVVTAAPLICIWLYFARMESSPRQATFAKRWLGLKVVNLEGGRIDFRTATARHFGHYLSGIFLMGFLVQPFNPRKQAWHDLLSQTLVVRDRSHSSSGTL